MDVLWRRARGEFFEARGRWRKPWRCAREALNMSIVVWVGSASQLYSDEAVNQIRMMSLSQEKAHCLFLNR